MEPPLFLKTFEQVYKHNSGKSHETFSLQKIGPDMPGPWTKQIYVVLYKSQGFLFSSFHLLRGSSTIPSSLKFLEN